MTILSLPPTSPFVAAGTAARTSVPQVDIPSDTVPAVVVWLLERTEVVDVELDVGRLPAASGPADPVAVAVTATVRGRRLRLRSTLPAGDLLISWLRHLFPLAFLVAHVHQAETVTFLAGPELHSAVAHAAHGDLLTGVPTAGLA